MGGQGQGSRGSAAASMEGGQARGAPGRPPGSHGTCSCGDLAANAPARPSPPSPAQGYRLHLQARPRGARHRQQPRGRADRRRRGQHGPGARRAEAWGQAGGRERVAVCRRAWCCSGFTEQGQQARWSTHDPGGPAASPAARWCAPARAGLTQLPKPPPQVGWEDETEDECGEELVFEPLALGGAATCLPEFLKVSVAGLAGPRWLRGSRRGRNRGPMGLMFLPFSRSNN
jgi:hypothetical protein